MRYSHQWSFIATRFEAAAIRLSVATILFWIAIAWPVVASSPAIASPPAGGDSPTSTPLTFEQLLNEARQHDPALARDDAALQAAQGDTLQAGLFPNPRLRLRFSNYPVNQPDQISSNDFDKNGVLKVKPKTEDGTGKESFRLMQPLPIGGRLRKGVEVGRAEQRHIAAVRRAHEQQLEGELRKAWTLAFCDYKASQAMREMLGELEKSHAVAKKRFEGLKSPLIDINRVEWEIQALNADYQKTRGDLGEDLARLGGLAGTGLIGIERLAPPPDDVTHPTTAAIQTDWTARRAEIDRTHPAVGAAEAAVDTARRELALTKAERIPDLEIGGGMGYSDTNDQTDAEFLTEINIPLFDRKQGRIKKNEARIAEAQAVVDIKREEILVKFDEAHARLNNATEKDTYLRQTAIPQNEAAFARFSKGFNGDVIEFNDFFNAQRQLLRTRVDLLKANRDLLEAYIDLTRMTGGLE